MVWIPDQIPVSGNPWVDGWVRMGWRVAPSDYSDAYPTHRDILGKWGLQAHKLEADRDAIKVQRRSWAMVVTLLDWTAYQLKYNKVDMDIMNNANREALDWSGWASLSFKVYETPITSLAGIAPTPYYMHHYFTFNYTANLVLDVLWAIATIRHGESITILNTSEPIGEDDIMITYTKNGVVYEMRKWDAITIKRDSVSAERYVV